ncbi:hypothetical protein BN988_01623 [Oceanobacillus picturae]|uniref:Uncharacterized protein n=1 Tax=Oceanobacillus picturae TaxID=171693 RepID=W9ACB9_9BACI|nr:hypothetical protein [Oceanobacillus picturae]CDO03123.1 hypothetical protein BN988_01623 [Oceanobacillus picturae]
MITLIGEGKPLERSKDREVGEGLVRLLDDMEKFITKEVLEEITGFYNQGNKIVDIAATFRMDPDFVFIALFHQARNGNVIWPFAYRISSEVTE